MKDYCNSNIDDVFIVLNDFNTLNENIRILELGPKKPSSLKYDVSEAYGQDGYTKVSEGAFRGFERTSRLMVSSEDSYIRFMSEFYIGKDVKVYYSDDNYEYRFGTISELEDEVIIGANREIILTIDLQPFKYEASNKLEITKKTTLYNSGNVYTNPVIKVYGNGRGKVYINNQTMDLDVDQYLIIDNEEIDIFDKNGLRANSRRKSGNFMRIEEGKNIINFDGAVTKVELEINWRWR